MSLFACDACDRVYLTGYESLGRYCPYCGGSLRASTREEAVTHAIRGCTSEAEAPPPHTPRSIHAIEAHLAELRENRLRARETSAQVRQQSAQIVAKARCLLRSSEVITRACCSSEAPGEVQQVNDHCTDAQHHGYRDDEVYIK